MCSGISANLCSGQIIRKHRWMNHEGLLISDFTGLTRCSSRGYRKNALFVISMQALKGIITTLHPLSKFRTDKFVSVGSLLAEVLCDTWSLMNE